MSHMAILSKVCTRACVKRMRVICCTIYADIVAVEVVAVDMVWLDFWIDVALQTDD